MVLLSAFLCCIYCRKSKSDQKSSKDKATVIPDTSLDKTIESRKTALDESNKPEVKKNQKARITVQQKEEVIPTTTQQKVKVPALKIDKLSNQDKKSIVKMPSEPLAAKEKKEPYLDPKIANHPNNFLLTRPKNASIVDNNDLKHQKEDTSSKLNSGLMLTGGDKPVTLKINLVMDKSKTQMYHNHRRISQGVMSQKGGDETNLPIDIS